MPANRRDALKVRMAPAGDIKLPDQEKVPGVAPALVEHLLDVFGEALGYAQLQTSPGVSISEAALIASAIQAGRDQVLNYIITLAENAQ